MSKFLFSSLLILFLFLTESYSQISNDSISVKVNLHWKNEKLELNKNYISNNDTLQINLFKLYISGLEINYNDNTFYKENNSYHLIDIENENSLYFQIPSSQNKTISKVVFNIGVDSTASVSGALSGDLDVTKGMYWAWQSGFINMKIEGKSNSCKTRKNAFNFHIGGYLNPNYTIRKVILGDNYKINANNEVSISVNLAKLFDEINLSESNSIMIPGKEAMKIADQSIKIFSLE